MKNLLDKLQHSKHVAVFTGAGVSTLCGLPDFRGPQGLYKLPDAERMFDIEWFYRDPSIYYKNSMELIYGLRNVEPGPVHLALAVLEKNGIPQEIITQNIDMLHQKAGSSQVYEVHGSPMIHRCIQCKAQLGFAEICALLEKTPVPYCKVCQKPYKPDVTFFGEQLPQEAYASAIKAARKADLMLVLGSSLTVYPAAGLPQLTLERGGELVIINAQSTPLDQYSTMRYHDLAAFAAAVLEQYKKAIKSGGFYAG